MTTVYPDDPNDTSHPTTDDYMYFLLRLIPIETDHRRTNYVSGTYSERVRLIMVRRRIGND